jgi:hypothetical protein
MQKHSISLVILLGALVCQLQASTVVPASLKELSERAQQVAIGRIERITSYKDPSTGIIRSRIEMTPTHSLTGSPAPSLTFEMAGGVFEGVGQWIAGFPMLHTGDHVVLFLAGDTTTPFGPTVGLWQGVFFVETDRATGAQTLANHKRQPIAEIRGENLVLSQRAATGLALQPSAPKLTLDSFLDQVRVWRPIPANPNR